MADNAQKTPLAFSVNAVAQQQALDLIAQLGKALPATVTAVVGSIVTVSIDVQTTAFTLPPVTCPVACSQWIRDPVQIGDQGVLEPADASLGGISGLGTGTAGLNIVANLTAVVWKPVANATWDMDDPGKALVNGPTGAIIRTQDKTVTLTLSKGGGVVIKGSGAALALVLSSFQPFFDAHVHSSGGAGPPTVAMPNSLLTTILTAE